MIDNKRVMNLESSVILLGIIGSLAVELDFPQKLKF